MSLKLDDPNEYTRATGMLQHEEPCPKDLAKCTKADCPEACEDEKAVASQRKLDIPTSEGYARATGHFDA